MINKNEKDCFFNVNKILRHINKNHDYIDENKPENSSVSFLLKMSSLTANQMRTSNLNVSYQGYMDKNYDGQCGIPSDHLELFQLMKQWIEIAGKYNISWWMVYGSLIGSLRHHDMIPWDTDIDIGIPNQYESLIRKIRTPRQQISAEKLNIILRPNGHCPYNGVRKNCKGEFVNSHEDGCSFCGPLARIFFHPDIRIDIYLFELQIYDNQLKILDEGIFEYMTEPIRFPVDWYFPLRNCSMMALTVQCPNQSEKILNDYYGDFQMRYKCLNGKWIKFVNNTTND